MFYNRRIYVARVVPFLHKHQPFLIYLPLFRLDDLKKNVMNSNHSNEVKVVHDTEEIYESNANIGSDRVAKLIEERDTLLQTGVYTMDDPVISELDKEIRQALSNNGWFIKLYHSLGLDLCFKHSFSFVIVNQTCT